MIIGNKMTSGHGERKKKQGAWDGHQAGSPEPQEVCSPTLPARLDRRQPPGPAEAAFKFPDLHSKAAPSDPILGTGLHSLLLCLSFSFSFYSPPFTGSKALLPVLRKAIRSLEASR